MAEGVVDINNINEAQQQQTTCGREWQSISSISQHKKNPSSLSRESRRELRGKERFSLFNRQKISHVASLHNTPTRIQSNFELQRVCMLFEQRSDSNAVSLEELEHKNNHSGEEIESHSA